MWPLEISLARPAGYSSLDPEQRTIKQDAKDDNRTRAHSALVGLRERGILLLTAYCHDALTVWP